MSDVCTLDDAFFADYAKTKLNDKPKKGSSYTPKNYESIAYAGTDKGHYKVVRLLGAPIGTEALRPSYKRTQTDPHEIIVADIKDDTGTRFTVRMPLPAERESDCHILYRLYNKVTEKVYINKKPVFPNEAKFPELYKLVTKGGFKESDGNAYTYSKGYKGDRVVIYNVIDRSDDWCKNNKHTKILARDVTVDDQNRVWAKAGLKSFGFINKIRDLCGKYGFYEKFDVAIKKTGVKENPFEVKNVSRLLEKDMMEELIDDDGGFSIDKDRVAFTGPLTAEEMAYKQYDIEKIYAPTSYNKLLERIPNLFKLCDACLGTQFYEELQGLAQRETAEREAKRASEEAAQVEAENAAIRESLGAPGLEETVESNDPLLGSSEVLMEGPAPTIEEAHPTRRSATGGLSADKIALLKGYDMLPEASKRRIKDVTHLANGDVKIVWDTEADCLACDTCNAMSPEEGTTHCPVCGIKFEA